MANVTREQSELTRQTIINAAAESFLENGYTFTTIKSISARTGISVGGINCHFRTKEDVLYELTGIVLLQQSAGAERLMDGRTDDPVLLYAAETVLQLHIVEMNENLRDVYTAVYSLPRTSDLLQQTAAKKAETIFKGYIPQPGPRDFYFLEIAASGIMRGFITVSCSMWFSMDAKVEAFLRSTLRVYCVPDEKIEEAIAFVGGIDFRQAAKETVDGIFRYLEEQREDLQRKAKKRG